MSDPAPGMEAAPAAATLRPAMDLTPWGERAVPLGDFTRFRIGPLEIAWCWVANELRISTRDLGAEGLALVREAGLDRPAPIAPGPAPTEPIWTRWVVPQTSSRVSVRPVFPDRPLILSPDHPLRLLPTAEARIYVRIPVWVRLELPGVPPKQLTDLPTVILSETWFGSFMDGELCYWSPTTARRQMNPAVLAEHLAVAPIHIVNESSEPLHVEKLCLRVQHLTLFSLEGHLWGDETRIAYQGGGQFSRVRWSGRPPNEASGAVLLAPPREPVQNWLTYFTFDRLMGLSAAGHR